MIVADANLIAYHALPGQFSDIAIAVLRKDPEWVAPPFWRIEFRSILLQHMKVTKLQLVQARQVMSLQIERFRDRELTVPDDLVLDVAQQYGISAYDAEYVALAFVRQKPLVTADQRLIKATMGVAVSLEDFAACS